MGNRAVITTENPETNPNAIGVYVHWCGDWSQIETILTYCKLGGTHSPEEDNEGWGHLVGILHAYTGLGRGVCVDTVENLDCDNKDNGTYIIKDWEIVDTMYRSYGADEDEGVDFELMLDIDDLMPRHLRIRDKVLGLARSRGILL